MSRTAPEEYESVWSGHDALTDGLVRDYAAMSGEGWEPVWEPTSPLTTPWYQYAQWAEPDPDQFVWTRFARACRRVKREPKLVKDWQREYVGVIHQQGVSWH